MAGDNGTVILDEEPVAGSGMAAALKLAMSKGYLEKEETKRITVSKSGQELQAQRYTIEDKVVYVSFSLKKFLVKEFCVFYTEFSTSFLFFFCFCLGKMTSIREGIALTVPSPSSKRRKVTNPRSSWSTSMMVAKR